MKKKVLALVVLAAMLVSILPFAAFAAVQSSVSRVYVSEDTAEADGDDVVEFDVMLMDNSSGNAELVKNTAVDLYVYSSRGASESFYLDGAEDGYTTDSDTYKSQGFTVFTNVTTADGWVTVQGSSLISGTGRVYIGVAEAGSTAADFVANFQSYLNGNVSALNASIIPDSDGNYASSYTFTATDNYNVVFTDAGDHTGMAANGARYYDVEVTVTSNGMPVSGVDVEFSVDKTGATLTAYEATTDARGQAEVRITATKADTYTVSVEVDGKSAPSGEPEWEEEYTFGAATINTVRKLSDDNQKIALDESDVTLKFAFYDANGNRIKLSAGDVETASYDNGDGSFIAGNLDGVSLMTMTKPSGADINDELEVGNDFTMALDSSDNLEIEIQQDVLSEEGDYEIRLALMNGSSATYSFNVKEQGTITDMTLEYDTTSIAAETGASTGAATVKLLDAEGYAKEVNLPNNDIRFAIDNASVASIDSGTGAVTEDTDEPAVVTVTAVDSDSNQVATATINIVKKPSALRITADSSNTVGEEATLDVQLIDIDGKPVAYGANSLNSAEVEVVVLDKPDGAIVNGDDDTVTEDVEESGSFQTAVTSNQEGQVRVQVLLTVETTAKGTVGDPDYVAPETKVYTGSAVVNFGAASAVTGQNIIFMVGSSSYLVDGVPMAATATPFVENGRTYLGIRDMAYSMGITGDENVQWDNATQTATITKDGITVQVTVGANAIRVTKDGVTTEVAIDAPAQNRDGRVYLPFRAVFEAFGYSVEYVNGVITCI